MAGTFHQIYIQIVFGVRNRDRLIPQNKKTTLHKYITGVVQNNKCKMICINSVPDHIHFLMGFHPTICISNLVKDIKLATNDLIKKEKWVAGKFYWQAGFGAFSYSRSDIDKACRYISNQEEHHKRITFKEEYEKLLKEFKVVYDPKYILDF